MRPHVDLSRREPFGNWHSELAVFDGGRGDARVCVAVVDGPVDLSHPSLAGADLAQAEIPSADPSDPVAALHGTYVASILFGQPGSGVEGLVPRCRGLVVPVLRACDGVLAASQVDLARGISLALSHGANVINISAGQPDVSGEANPYLADMVRRCAEMGVLIVAAAGNDGCACLHVPAAAGWVLAVGALDAHGAPLDESNWGAAYLGHSILAPGDAICGAAAAGGTGEYRGTSSASAIVSGVAALLLAQQLHLGRTPDVSRVRAAILESAIGCRDEPIADCRRLLGGRLNITGAWARITEEGRKSLTITPEFTDLPTGGPSVPPGVEVSGCGCGGPSQGGCGCGGAKKSCGCGGSGHAGCGGSDKGGCTCSDKHASEPAAKRNSPSLVFVLGQLAYDFATEARRDSFVQRGVDNPHDPAELLRHLQENRAIAAAVTWTLLQDSTAVYAIQPGGPFAAEVYEVLQRFLRQQLDGSVERISVAGWIAGKTTLSSGQTVPVVIPDVRGLYSWSTKALGAAVLGPDVDAGSAEAVELSNFLQRVYYELRNLGLLPQERAVNFAATNAFQVGEIYRRNLAAGMKLDSIGVERSPICRPDSDCWDVLLTFFHPAKRLEQAREVFRLTVDVSDVVPVTVGPTRNWFVY